MAALCALFPCGASATGHWYGIDNLHQVSYGAQGNARVYPFTIPGIDNNFVDQEIWVANDSYSPDTWVEAGLTEGWGGNKGPTCYAVAYSPTFFWAVQKPSGNYDCHLGTATADTGTFYPVSVQYVGNESDGTINDWVVDVGPMHGTATNAQNSGDLLQAGTEATEQSATSCGSIDELYYTDKDGLKHDGWTNSGGDGWFYNDEPPHAEWVHDGHWVMSRMNEPSCTG